MFLTEGERRELYKSLHLMKEGDVPMMSSMPTDPLTTPASSSPGIPAFGSFPHGFPPAFAPHPGYGQPMMPVATPTTPVAPSTIPVAPSTLPVIGAAPGGGK